MGTSGDYAPFSFEEEGGELEGFEIELAKRFSADHDMKLEFVRFRWPDLLKDISADKFDVAMSGVTVRADRSLAARFTVPTTTSGAVVIVPSDSSYSSMMALDKEGIRIGVNKGGHLERVSRKVFNQAEIVTSSDNQVVPDLLNEGKIDALVTDTLEAPHWLARLPGARALPPFTQDRKAWLVRLDKADLIQQLDAWLLKKEADGTLAVLRTQYFGSSDHEAIAHPVNALLAAMDERLSLMPLVAESKRFIGRAVEDKDQEKLVLESAWESIMKEAQNQKVSLPDRTFVDEFFIAQIEAAKWIQLKVLSRPSESSEIASDLENELRPALGRISQSMNVLIIHLLNEPAIDSHAWHHPVEKALQRHDLPDRYIQAISSSLENLFSTASKR